MKDTKYGNLSLGLIAAWGLLAIAASALQLFRNESARPPLAFIVAVVAPLAIFAIWYSSSPAFRQLTLTLNLKYLTFAQLWRINGFVFLTLMTYGLLPRRFALSAGWGDIFIGTTAPLVAAYLVGRRRRWAFIVWQWLGITDLVLAIFFGATARFFDPTSVPMLPMTVLPLSIVPTFLVPLFGIFHVISIAQARRWKTTTTPPLHSPYPSTI